MKQSILKRLWGMLFGLVLIAAVPFIAFAQSGRNEAKAEPGTTSGENAKPPAPQRTARPQASENGDLNALLRALEKTPGVSEVELDLVRRRIADLERRRIEQMQGQDQQGDIEKSAPASGTSKEPAGAGEVTLTLKGNFDGRGAFVFEGNTIRYQHEQNLEPVNVTVDGKPWPDLKKPFTLGFTPDFGKAVVIDKLGRGTVKLIPGGERFELLIDDSKITSSARYQVVIAAKNQIARPPTEPTDPVSLTVKGVFGGRGTFVFEGKTIQYRHENGNEPSGVTIDGVPWDDLANPFALSFMPDFAKAVIEEQTTQTLTRRRVNVTLIPKRDRIELTVNSIEPAEYSVKIAAKNQNRRTNLPPPRSIGPAGPFGQPIRTGPTDGEAHPGYPVTCPVISPPEGMYNGAKVEVKGMVDRKAAFRFDGMNLIYQNYATDPDGASGADPALFDGKFAYDVTVNGREWPALAKPFPVGARIDTAKATEIRFQAEDCAIAFSEHGKVLEVIVTNKTGEPAPFQFTLWIEGAPRSNRYGNSGFGGFGGGM